MSKALHVKGTINTHPSILGGACLIANVCVGAGMLGLPSAGAGAWIFWSLFALILTMSVLLLSGWMLLEAYQGLPFKVSFNTLTQHSLGTTWTIINSISVYFVGAILLYAYISSLGGLAESILGFNSKISAIVIVLFFSAFVWHSTKAVERMSLIFIIFLITSFLLGTTDLLSKVNINTLLNLDEKAHYAPYALAMFPVALTAFGYHHSVSTMRDHYQDESRAKYALLWGVLIALGLYTIWLISVYGNLSRPHFMVINEAGGNVDALLGVMGTVLNTQHIENALHTFSVAAILSSFVGVGLGMFDFLADLFGFKDSRTGRANTWLVTFIPPLLMSLALPFGFVVAIGYAGAIATIWACFIPALLVLKKRQQRPEKEDKFKTPGGLFSVYLVIVFGALTALFHILNMLNVLPQYSSL